jgi:hypothetical protein
VIRTSRESPNWFAPIAEGKLGCPALVLAFYPNPRSFDCSFPAALARNSDREWNYVEHQTAGVNCKQRAFWVASIVPTRHAVEGMRRIEARWFGTDLGMGPDPNAAAEYQASLKTLFGEQVNCKESLSLLEEGMYPLDLDTSWLEYITDDRLRDFLHEEEPKTGLLRISNRSWTLRLLILGANSD